MELGLRYKTLASRLSARCCALSDVSAGLPSVPSRANGNPQFSETAMAKSTLIKSRQAAFLAQSGRCFYCDHPMWDSEPEKFSQRLAIGGAKRWRFQCTAEHLVPRELGGRDTRDNIVAACAYCNQQRHRPKRVRNPIEHRAHVQRRLERGRWHLNFGVAPDQGHASGHMPGTGCTSRTGQTGSFLGP